MVLHVHHQYQTKKNIIFSFKGLRKCYCNTCHKHLIKNCHFNRSHLEVYKVEAYWFLIHVWNVIQALRKFESTYVNHNLSLKLFQVISSFQWYFVHQEYELHRKHHYLSCITMCISFLEPYHRINWKIKTSFYSWVGKLKILRFYNFYRHRSIDEN